MVHELVREIVRTRAMRELSYEIDDKECPKRDDDRHQDEDKSDDTVISLATMEYLKSPTSTAPMKVETQENDEEERCCCTIM